MNFKILFVSTIVLSTLLVFSCKDEEVPTQNIDLRLQKIIGDYYATKFILPGQTDGTINILAKGGAVSVKITKLGLIEGRVIIPPKTFYSSDPGDDYYFNGKVVFIGRDSLRFIDTNNSFGIAPFRIMGDSLRMAVYSISPIIITIKKNS